MGGEEGIKKEVMRFATGLTGYFGWVFFFFSGLIFFQNTLSLLNMKKLRDPRFDIVRLSQVPWWLKLSGVYGLQILFGIITILTSWGLIAYCGVEKLDYSFHACWIILVCFTVYYCSYIMPFVCWWIFGATIYRKLSSKLLRIGFLFSFFLFSIWLMYQYLWVITFSSFKILPPINIQPLLEPIEKLSSFLKSDKTDVLTDMVPLGALHAEPMLIGLFICFMIYLSSSWVYSKTK